MSTSTKRPPLCNFQGCDRSAYQNSDGSYSSWCSKTHRDAGKVTGAVPTARSGNIYASANNGPRMLCSFQGCNRGVYQNPDGSYSPWCGKTHRDAARGLGTAPMPGSSSLCQNCQKRPVYIEPNGRAHNFCGRTCATEFDSNRARNLTSSSQPPLTTQPRQGKTVPATNAGASSLPGSSHTQTCAFRGCFQVTQVFTDGVPDEFCSDDHRREAVKTGQVEACLLCMQLPKAIFNGKRSDFCSERCGNDALLVAPYLFNISDSDKAYKEVCGWFVSQWKSPGDTPTVHKIWKIYGDKNLNDEFLHYQHDVEQRSGVQGGNIQRRFYGTVRACKLGDDERDRELCSSDACYLCGIIRTSFRLVHAEGPIGTINHFGRIYTSTTSSKANKSVIELGGSTFKAMLLNEVIMGRTISLASDDPSLTQPPPGHDSAVGEPGGPLDDEAIVYSVSAIRPAYLVIYN